MSSQHGPEQIPWNPGDPRGFQPTDDTVKEPATPPPGRPGISAKEPAPTDEKPAAGAATA